MPGNISEPNGNWSGTAVETCMVANYTELTVNMTWGWADANCTSKFGYICRINGGQPANRRWHGLVLRCGAASLARGSSPTLAKLWLCTSH